MSSPSKTKRTKAEILLGIDGKADSASSVMRVQSQGWVQLKELSTSPLLGFRKRFCIVKDGFMMWYSSAPSSSSFSTSSFDRKPKGIMPLNGAYVSLKSGGQGIIELMHPDIQKSAHQLKFESEADARIWFAVFDRAKKATWENAQLGVAVLEKVKARGTKLEAEKEAAVKELEDKIEKLNKAKEAKVQLLAKQEEQMKKFQDQLTKQQQEVLEKEEQKARLEQALTEEQKLAEEAENQRRALERKLAMANMALRRLETALENFMPSGDPNEGSRLSTVALERKKSTAEAYHNALQQSQTVDLDAARKSKHENARTGSVISMDDNLGTFRSFASGSLVSPNGGRGTPQDATNDPDGGRMAGSAKGRQSKGKLQKKKVKDGALPPPAGRMSNKRGNGSASRNARARLQPPAIPTKLGPGSSQQDVKRSVLALRSFFEGVRNTHKAYMDFYNNENFRELYQNDFEADDDVDGADVKDSDAPVVTEGAAEPDDKFKDLQV